MLGQVKSIPPAISTSNTGFGLIFLQGSEGPGRGAVGVGHAKVAARLVWLYHRPLKPTRLNKRTTQGCDGPQTLAQPLAQLGPL